MLYSKKSTGFLGSGGFFIVCLLQKDVSGWDPQNCNIVNVSTSGLYEEYFGGEVVAVAVEEYSAGVGAQRASLVSPLG